MKIYGLDFTSAPNPRKPITCLACILNDNRNRLYVDDTLEFFGDRDFVLFENFLNRPGPWLAGLDFPFGQPQKLIQNLGWPETWPAYIQTVANLGKRSFEQTLAVYRQDRLPGDKYHLRATDCQARSRSPMMLHRVPVGKMFFEGAPRLLKSGVSIVPCRPTDDSRIVVEAYPALVARRWIDKRSYKNDAKRKQTPEQVAARRDIIAGLHSDELPKRYGFSVELSDKLAAELIQDPTGDPLDALLCAIQAAWAYKHDFPPPLTHNLAEGWIFDPELL